MDLDPSLIRTLNSLDRETRQRLLMYEKDIKKALEEHTERDQIKDKQTLFRKIGIAAGAFGVGMGTALVVHNRRAARRAITSDNKELLETFVNAGANRNKVRRYLIGLADNTSDDMAKGLLKRNFPGTKVNVGQRIKTLQDGSEKVVRNLIELGIRDGKSSWDIAKMIEQYVTPNQRGLRVAPWTITRRRFGQPVSYIPRGIPAGSVEYNAFRIARSETAETYQQATYNAHKNKWYYEGIKWHLSNAHPEPDECDEYAEHDEGIGKGVWREKPRLPHPHCICYTTTVTTPTDDLIAGLKLTNWI